jgi:hypothetical protein
LFSVCAPDTVFVRKDIAVCRYITNSSTTFFSKGYLKETNVTTVNATVPGYTYGNSSLAPSPVSLSELESLKKTLLLSDEDLAYLRLSAAILKDQTEAILDVWYGFVGSTPELVYFFGNVQTGQPDAAYLAAVRKRFAKWIMDTAEATYDQAWLDYQYEIGLRHHRTKKNKTDNAPGVPEINYRYIPALTIPITTTLKPFLAKGGHSAEEVEKMHAAWVKSVLLQSILWGYPYIREGQF